MIKLLMIVLLGKLIACETPPEPEPEPQPEPESKPMPFQYDGDAFFVAPWGDDGNPGTSDEPWETWGRAFTAREVGPGDTVMFRGGIYYKDPSQPSSYFRGNTSGYQITTYGRMGDTVYYMATPGEVPILDCNSIRTHENQTNYGIYASGISYVKFKGLHIRNVWQKDSESGADGFTLGGSNCVIENCVVYNVHGTGFSTWESYDVQYINCDAYNCCDSLSSYLPGNDGYGFYTRNNNTTSGAVYYTYCRAWNCGDDGFVTTSISYVEYDGCWSFNNGQLDGGGHGFKLGFYYEDPTSLLRTMKNCMVAYNREPGITFNDRNGRCVTGNLYNNIVYHNGFHEGWSNKVYGILISNTAESDENELKKVLRNNISFDNKSGSIHVGVDALYSHSHNSWDPDLYVSASDFISLDSTGISGERINGELPDIDFLKLKEDSPLKTAGIDLGLHQPGEIPGLGPVW